MSKVAVACFAMTFATAPAILAQSPTQAVRDLWRQQALGTFEDKFSATVRPQGAVLVRVVPSN